MILYHAVSFADAEAPRGIKFSPGFETDRYNP